MFKKNFIVGREKTSTYSEYIFSLTDIDCDSLEELNLMVGY